MSFSYNPKGTCSTEMTFDIVEGKVHNLRIRGGCRGNRRGLSSLIEGMPVDDIISRLKGIECQNGTSCPDQLAQAMLAYQKSVKKNKK
ncbi:MAG: TIGR03905 family TSCPD domain-containing protein [Spirochaetes bacterium]|nr:TIGR03905 family TSCPD domain-containing protein [Spirochaetota bacterium]